jgi:3-oxoacyl-[acyl-carrier protein] reductase
LAAMDLGIAGRVALVTGASKGIGRAIAAELVAEGAKVAISSRSQERIEAAAAALGARGFVHDSADLDGTQPLIDAVENELGPVEILVVNTGGPPPGDPLAHPVEEWRDAHRDLVLTPMALVERVLPGMRERRWGRIVQIASSSVREPLPGLMLSNVHRVGALAAFKTIARQVAADGVTLNTVLPGRIATERLFSLMGGEENAQRAGADVPAARLGTPAEMAAAAAFLCSERAGYITGSALAVDGGMLHGL